MLLSRPRLKLTGGLLNTTRARPIGKPADQGEGTIVSSVTRASWLQDYPSRVDLCVGGGVFVCETADAAFVLVTGFSSAASD